MQTFLFMDTPLQSLVHRICHKPILKWLAGSLYVLFHSENCLLPLTSLFESIPASLSHCSVSAYLVFYQVTSCTFTSFFITECWSHWWEVISWYDDVLASSVHSCSQPDPALNYLCQCLLHVPVGSRIKCSCLTHSPFQKPMIHFTVPF